MCYICSASPNSDPLSQFDTHDGLFVPSSGSGMLPGMIGSGTAGPAPSSAPYTLDQIADYLTDGYWGSLGGAWRAFVLDQTRTITYDVSRLSAAAAAIAEYSLDVWAAATGINFVDISTAATAVSEAADIGGTIATARAIGTNTIVSARVGVTHDSDYYAVTLTAGQTYLMSLHRGPSSSLDPVLSLYDASGNLLVSQDAPSPSAGEYISFTATTTGTYYVAARDYSSGIGTYELSIQTAADLTFNDADPNGAYAWSEMTGNEILQSYINVHDSWSDLNLNGYMLPTYIHEIGHALGLGHAGPYNGSAVWGTDNIYDNDSWSVSIMSYFDQLDNTFDPADFAYQATIMPADLIAIQNLYGAGAGYQTGDTVWGPGGNLSDGTFQLLLDMWGGLVATNPQIYAGNTFSFIVYDTGGTDTLDFSAFAANQNINLNQLVSSNIGGVLGNVVIARDTVIENAVGGAGNDTLTGNSAHNLLQGGAGNDHLVSTGGGNDTLHGGLGMDLAVLGVASTAVTVTGTTAQVLIAYAGGSVTATGVENFQFSDGTLTLEQVLALPPGAPSGPTAGDDTLTGTEGNDTIDALAGNDVISGLAGNDLLYGREGADTLYGGDGDDTLAGGAGADALYGGAGSDTASYEDATAALRADLQVASTNTGFATGDSYNNVENLSGSSFGDVLLGDGLGNTIRGEAGNDQLWGRAGDDRLFGGEGNDTLIGGAGADMLDGGAGRDRVQYNDSSAGLRVDLQLWATNTGIAAGDVFAGVEDLYGSAHNDTLAGDGGDNMIWGDNGNDQLTGRLGNDTLIGGAGNDTLIGGAGADRLDGGAGRDRVQYNDTAAGLRADLQVSSSNTGIAAGDTYISIEDLYGSRGNDVLLGDSAGNVIWGDDGNDQLWGRGGNDTLYGGAGNDTLIGGAGADHLDGGAGRDRVQYNDTSAGVRVDLQVSANNTGAAIGDTYSGIEDLYGSLGNDRLLGDAGGNMIWGDNGNDQIWGRAGDDTLFGGNGNDSLTGGVGADLLNGGAGRDRAMYNDTSAGLRADLQAPAGNTGIARGDTYVSIEDLHGSLGNDVLLGDAVGNMIWGDNGNDQILGRAGNDSLYGGAGNDILTGGVGADLLDGGAGRDRAQYNDTSLGLRADLQNAASNTGIALGDSYISIEDLYGSLGNDTLLGDAVGNMIWGDNGNDQIWGRDGNDSLYGGAGNDRLYGGAGADVLTGGAGTDTFVFDSALGSGNIDRITDFSVIDDVIWLDDAVFTALAPGFLASNAFALGAAASTAQHRIIYNQANGQLIYDANGNAAGGAVVFATLAPALALSVADFLIV